MTVQLTWDADPPITGLPDQGSDTKVYPPTPAAANAEVEPEPVGSGTVVEAPFSVPLITTPDADTVAPGGTLTVTGSGLAPSSSGTLALVAGPPGTTGGTVLVSVSVTADALGAIPPTALAVPAGATEGEYHLVLSGGAVIVDTTAITVGTVTPTPTVTPDVTEVEAGGTVTVTGTGFPASTAGRVALYSGATEVVGADVTTDATGAFAAAPLIVPAGTAPGDLALRATVGAATSPDVTVTVTEAPAEPVITADKDTVDSSGDETARTVTVSGTGFPAALAGRVSIMTGAPGTGGTEVVGADVTTGADGSVAATPLIVPAAQAAGDYHIHAEYAGVTVDDLPLTVTGAAPTPTVIPGTTTVEAGTDLVVAGTGFPASTAGRVSLFDGATEVAGADVTTDASGEFAGAVIAVPPETAAGTYQLRGVVGAATSADVAITVTAAPIPDPPTGLVLSDIGPASMAATWDAVTGAESYVIYYRPTAETAWMVAGEVTAPTVTATVASLTAETSYDVAVATVIGGVVSDLSAPETGVTVGGGTPLAQVVAVAGTPTASSVPLTWDAVTDAQSYQVRWRESADVDWAPTYGTEDGAATGTSMEGLTAGTAYTFGVRAIGDGTTNTSGPWSADVTATTAAAVAARKRASRKKSA